MDISFEVGVVVLGIRCVNEERLCETNDDVQSKKHQVAAVLECDVVNA